MYHLSISYKFFKGNIGLFHIISGLSKQLGDGIRVKTSKTSLCQCMQLCESLNLTLFTM